jgi:endogenous inhibitor of DNA gyrase (YacG/DUF329 family)
MSQMRCPICRVTFDSDHSSALPFCSSRCRQIDLNRWLGEEYSLPTEPEKEPPEPDFDEE